MFAAETLAENSGKESKTESENDERQIVKTNQKKIVRINRRLFIVTEVNPYLEESPIHMHRFKSQAELALKFSELSKLATKVK